MTPNEKERYDKLYEAIHRKAFTAIAKGIATGQSNDAIIAEVKKLHPDQNFWMPPKIQEQNKNDSNVDVIAAKPNKIEAIRELMILLPDAIGKHLHSRDNKNHKEDEARHERSLAYVNHIFYALRNVMASMLESLLPAGQRFGE